MKLSIISLALLTTLLFSCSSSKHSKCDAYGSIQKKETTTNNTPA